MKLNFIVVFKHLGGGGGGFCWFATFVKDSRHVESVLVLNRPKLFPGLLRSCQSDFSPREMWFMCLASTILKCGQTCHTPSYMAISQETLSGKLFINC